MTLFRIFCTLFALSAFVPSFAQNADTAALKNTQVKINAQVFGAGLSLEQRLSSNVSLYAEGGYRAGAGLYYSRYNFSEGLKAWMPFAGLEGRYYYNLTKRAGNGKPTAHNSANFISLGVLHGFKSQSNNARYSYSTTAITPGWGMQRKAGKNLSIEFNAGLSVNYFDDEKEWIIGPGVGFKFGYVLK
jgi:hypothetical protein